MAISGPSRVRTELLHFVVIPAAPPHPVQLDCQLAGHRYLGDLVPPPHGQVKELAAPLRRTVVQNLPLTPNSRFHKVARSGFLRGDLSQEQLMFGIRFPRFPRFSVSAHNTHSKSTVLLGLACLVVSVVSVKAQDPPPPTEHQVIYAPIAGMEGFDNWELSMVTHTATEQPVSITIYSTDGRPFPTRASSIAPGGSRRIDIKSLLPKQSHESIGGVAIEYIGVPMAVAAQVTLRDFHGFGSLDDTLEDDMEFKSSTFDAVWWQTRSARSYVIVGNSSSNPVKVRLSYGRGVEENHELQPHATIVRPTAGAGAETEGGHIESVHVSSDAMAGAIRVVGFSASLPDRFQQTIRFLDSKGSTEPALYANGLHFTDASNHLVVKNLSDAPVMVSGTLYSVGHKSSKGTLRISRQQVGPGDVQELELPKRAQQLDNAALELDTSGNIGSLAAGFTSFDEHEQVTRSIPFKDIGDYSISTGGYPWRLDGDFNTRVFITNVGKVRAAIGAEIRPTVGKGYVIDTRYLEVGETAIFDLKELRDSQVPDLHGVKLPKKQSVDNSSGVRSLEMARRDLLGELR